MFVAWPAFWYKGMTSAVSRTLQILDYLARTGAQRLSDVARTFELPKSNVHRLLNSLAEENFVAQDCDTGRYFATLKTYELGSLIVNRDPLKRAGSPFVQQLHEATGETVALARLIDTDIVYIERVLTLNPLRGSLREGWRVPASFTAAGKVVLAYHPDCRALLERIIENVPEARDLDLSTLLDEFAAIRDQGYAFSRSGWTRGINSVACPIGNESAPPFGALALIVPSERLADEAVPEAALSVMRATAQINDMLEPR